MRTGRRGWSSRRLVANAAVMIKKNRKERIQEQRERGDRREDSADVRVVIAVDRVLRALLKMMRNDANGPESCLGLQELPMEKQCMRSLGTRFREKCSVPEATQCNTGDWDSRSSLEWQEDWRDGWFLGPITSDRDVWSNATRTLFISLAKRLNTRRRWLKVCG